MLNTTNQTTDRNLRARAFRDRLATWLVTAGGVSVIASVVLICVFLVYVVLPLFGSANVELYQDYALPVKDQGAIEYLAIDEYRESAVAIGSNGEVTVFQPRTGELINSLQLPVSGVALSSHALLNRVEEQLFFGLDNGRLLSTKIDYSVTYPNDTRTTQVSMQYPFGDDTLDTGLTKEPIDLLSVRHGNDNLLVATWQKNAGLHLLEYQLETSFLDDAEALQLEQTIAVKGMAGVSWVGIDSLYSWLYVVDTESTVHFYDIRDLEDIHLVHSLDLSDYGKISVTRFLTGNLSLIVGFDSGRLLQAFPVRRQEQAGNYDLKVIREFPAMYDAVVQVYPEYSRRGFFATDSSGALSVYYSTNAERLATIHLPEAVSIGNFAPRENAILASSEQGRTRLIRVDNSHPEISFSSLWAPLWYESYEQPDYTWQSSSSSDDFEPKFGLSPLTFGTLKAAFYAMLVATPLAIMAAIYTAFFLSSGLRQWVKPVIELMEALPTVILGFLAGLWLAPFIEKNLTFVFLLLLLVPSGVVAFGYASSRFTKPDAADAGLLNRCLSEEWRVVVLFPAVLGFAYISWLLQSPLESIFFGGDLRSWISNDLGIDYDQRNALVIGAVMGFAVIPTIFSITEDAVFAVPRHLVNGSLALGASNWQTLVGVVLPTASPGIFSAVMIGMGRAVGETMIVLMATGNTPVMDFSVFEGMRTLSANIAVEMPEAEVGSSHYRILFLAGLVLFVFTFFFNTLGELVRQRLRTRYGSL